MKKKLSAEDYYALAAFRRCIRGYIRFSERIVHNLGLEPYQYQLLLALKGNRAKVRPRIADVADQLQIQHHSAVGLVNRSERMGLVRREPGTLDRREVLVRLTPAGDKMIENLGKMHLAEVCSRSSELLNALHVVLARREKRQSSLR